MNLRRLVHTVFVRCLATLWLVVVAGQVHAATVLVVTANPVAPGKFVALQRLAEPLGLRIDARYAEKLPPETGPSLWDGADLVLIDAPRQHIEEFVRARLPAALPALERKPHVWLPTTAPKAGGGVDDTLAQRLHAYYVNGGRANSENLLKTIQAWLAKQPWASLPAPQVFPAAGIYHPKLPSLVLPTPADYLAWKKIDPANRPPIVAIAFHQQSIAAEQTAMLDTMVAQLEAAGVVALPFYSGVMESDAVRRMVTVDGKPVVDAIINTQITLNPEGRRAEFAALGVPVVQGMTYRRGDVAAWRADPQGVAVSDVPFYLAQAEYAGIHDIQVVAAMRKGDEQLEPIAAQASALTAKALKLVTLQRKPQADKRVAIFFWNYPAGEKNLSASFMNLPRSLSGTLAAMKVHGWRTETEAETPLTLNLQRLLAPGYRPPEDQEVLRSLLRDGLAERLPVSRYKAWLASLPADVQRQMTERWGAPEASSWVLRDTDGLHFIVPRYKLGHVVLLPQPGRGERGGNTEKSLYHSNSAVPSHHYMAVYLWVRQQFGADGIVHFGTHGTQEWLPGKERGLSVTDYPMLAVGDVPVVYPYIVDNIGESTQAKRRGRAVIVSHQTPPFAPAGLHDTLTRIHDLLHDWLAQDKGEVRAQLKLEFLAKVRQERIDRDLGWSAERIERDFETFVSTVHDHLHELSQTAQPKGLHTFGQGSRDDLRVATVLMMLGPDFWHGVAGPNEEADEMLVGDWEKLADSTPYRTLLAMLQGVDARIATLPEAARTRVAQARAWYESLGARNEMSALLGALDGRYTPTSYGGDPIKNPDALPTGRNLYGFDPSRVPTRAAWEAGRDAMDKLLAMHRQQTGKPLRKLSFTLWSVETMRHFGLLEAQALWALGVQPVWDAGGRVSDVKLIPRATLGRPRVDVVLSATGLYRDHFPNTMKWLARAAQLASQANDEPDNVVADNARRITQKLLAQGLPEAEAQRAGATRIFASASGRYGTGLDDAALATDTWKTQAEGDRKLAELYLSRMQFAYGPDEAEWGKAGTSRNPKLNLYAEHLRGTEAAVLARTSNLYGMLTTDDPFQYLGGIGLAVRHLDGKAPELYISNLRGTGAGRVERAAQFLAKELATRNFHPGYISGLMTEGYSGTLQVLDGLNNFAGWQSVAREIVRHDQWQEFMDVYVRDKHQLGLKKWFEANNPHALAQGIERMLEAARLGQWQADEKSVAELKERYRDLAKRHDVKTGNAAFKAFVDAGFGLQDGVAKPMPAPAATAALTAPPAPVPPPPPPIEGMLLEKVAAAASAGSPPLVWPAVLLLLLSAAGGAWRARPQAGDAFRAVAEARRPAA
jgi:cobaltochelatase CobN